MFFFKHWFWYIYNVTFTISFCLISAVIIIYNFLWFLLCLLSASLFILISALNQSHFFFIFIYCIDLFVYFFFAFLYYILTVTFIVYALYLHFYYTCVYIVRFYNFCLYLYFCVLFSTFITRSFSNQLHTLLASSKNISHLNLSFSPALASLPRTQLWKTLLLRPYCPFANRLCMLAYTVLFVLIDPKHPLKVGAGKELRVKHPLQRWFHQWLTRVLVL